MNPLHDAVKRILPAVLALLPVSIAAAGPPVGDECTDCFPIAEGVFEATTFDNTGTVDDSLCALNDIVDEWWCYTASCNGIATASTCNEALFDTSLAIFDGCGGKQIACNDDALGCRFDTSIVSWGVSAGTTYYIRLAGTFALQGDYVLMVDCAGCPGQGNCFTPSATSGCADEACCNLVFADFPSCCTLEWDETCVTSAIAQCSNASCPGVGSCLSANGSTGCNNAACCNAVCFEDDFCCAVVWDEICADAALTMCVDPSCPGTGSCFADNGTPGCSNPFCCVTVCLADPACCDVAWDQGCADFAQTLCNPPPGCGTPGIGSCFAPNPTPYCNIESCCDAVCVADPDCCVMAWDQSCADQATLTCEPANDDCVNATSISEGLTNFHTVAATTDGAPLTGFCDPGPFGDDQIDNDVWFVHVASCTGLLTVSTCGTANFDTRLAVYDGAVCPEDPASVLGCNDDGDGCAGFTSEVTVPVVRDQVYTIRLGGTSGDTGTGSLSLGVVATNDPSLTLSRFLSGPVLVGEQVDVTLTMADLCLVEAAGFQAFLQFDPAQVAFVSGTYPDAPFGLALIDPITATGTGEIDLASAVNAFAGQPPTSDDAVLAVLTFTLLVEPEACLIDITFRDHYPPTRLTTVGGQEILPLDVIAFPPAAGITGDVNFDGSVDVQDLVEVILSWGFCPGPPEYCPADLDCSGEVDVVDLVLVVLNWNEA